MSYHQAYRYIKLAKINKMDKTCYPLDIFREKSEVQNLLCHVCWKVPHTILVDIRNRCYGKACFKSAVFKGHFDIMNIPVLCPAMTSTLQTKLENALVFCCSHQKCTWIGPLALYENHIMEKGKSDSSKVSSNMKSRANLLQPMIRRPEISLSLENKKSHREISNHLLMLPEDVQLEINKVSAKLLNFVDRSHHSEFKMSLDKLTSLVRHQEQLSLSQPKKLINLRQQLKTYFNLRAMTRRNLITIAMPKRTL